MEIAHEWENGPEYLFSYCDGEDALREVKLLEPVFNTPDQTGSARTDDDILQKSNRGVYLEQVYTPLYTKCSPTTQIVESFTREVKKCDFTPNSTMQAIHSAVRLGVLVSAYKNGDYYQAHRDSALLTLLLWLGNKDFEGGDLYFPDFDYTVPYEPNKLIMFPSYYRHEVTPIRTDKEGYVRYCASAFIQPQ